MAAFAAALLADTRKFTPALMDGLPVWGLSSGGNQMYCDLQFANKLSILGAMRAAHETFDTDARAYNTLDRNVRHVAREKYNKDIKELDATSTLDVLLTVAKG